MYIHHEYEFRSMSNNNQLLTEYHCEPSHALRDKIFKRNQGLTFQAAHDFATKGVSEPFEDLVQLASIGLIKAIDKFDPGRGALFNTYAGIWMRHEILRHIRDKTSCVKISRTLTDIYEKGRKVERQLKRDGYANDVAIAKLIGVSIDKWIEAKGAHSLRRASSLDQFVVSEGVDDFTYDGSLGLHRHHLNERIELTPGELFLPDGNSSIEPVKLDKLEGINFLLTQSFFFEWQPITTLKKRASQLLIPRAKIVPILRDSVLSLNL